MRRAVALVVVAGLAVLVWRAPPPPPPPAPAFGDVEIVEGGDVEASVWYCPWAASGAVRDGYFGLASAATTDALVTVPSPVPGERPDRLEVHLDGPDARIVDLLEVIDVRRGDTPGLVEFTSGPAAAAAVIWADAFVTGDRCSRAVPKRWYLVGGTTAQDRFLTLRLFNPLAEDAKASVSAVSEFGPGAIPELEGLPVPGRSWVTVELGPLLPFLDTAALLVDVDEGVVVPSVIVADAKGEASWPGTGPATTWWFPVVTDGRLTPALELLDTGDGATVVIDLYTPTGVVRDAYSVELEAGRPLRLPLGDLAAPPFGVGLRASAPVVAAVTAVSPEAEPLEETAPGEEPAVPAPRPPGRAGTVGAAEAALRWLLPGVGGVADLTSTVWLLNPAEDETTVGLTPLGGGGSPEKVVVPAGSVVGVPAAGSDEEVVGYLVEASSPVVVAWSAAGERGVMLVAGTALR